MSRFNCLLDDDANDDETLAGRPVEKVRQLTYRKRDNVPQQWVKSEDIAVAAPAPDRLKKSKGKKSNSRQNKENLLKKLQSESKKVEITAITSSLMTAPASAPAPAPVEHAHLSAVKKQATPIPTPLIALPPSMQPDADTPRSWVTICAPDRSKSSNSIAINYRGTDVSAVVPEQTESSLEVRYKRVINALAYKHRSRREKYITTYGPDAYNKNFLSPNYDYNWMERPNGAQYVPDIYDPYPPEYLPYVITRNGCVKNFTYAADNTEADPTAAVFDNLDNSSDDDTDDEYIEKFTKHTVFLSS